MGKGRVISNLIEKARTFRDAPNSVEDILSGQAMKDAHGYESRSLENDLAFRADAVRSKVAGLYKGVYDRVETKRRTDAIIIPKL